MRDPMQALTSQDIRTMSQTEIREFWIARQQALKAKGLPHYETLIDLDGTEVAHA